MQLAEHCAGLPGAVRRILALTVLLAVAASAWVLVMTPLRALYESQQRWRETARQILAYSKGSVLALDQLGVEVSSMRASPLWSKLYRADQSGTAAGVLQSEVATMLANVKAGAQSLTPVRSTSIGSLTQIGVHVSAAMRIDQLQQFVSASRTHPKYLRVEQLTISAPQSQGPTENPVLTVDMDISGFQLTSRRVSVGANQERPR